MKAALFPLADLAPGTMRSVEVEGLRMVVVRTPEGKVYALRDRCPHRGASLSIGRLQRTVVGGEVGQYAFAPNYVVRCPWHGWEFDVTSGRCLADPEGTRVRAYEVAINDGMIVLSR